MSIQPERPAGPFGVGDDGSPDPALIEALSAFATGDGGSADVLSALAGGRLLVPMVAVLAPEHGASARARAERASVLAPASATQPDGNRGLLAFTSSTTMYRWNPASRPVSVTTRRAAETALADGVDALVIDPAGPVSFSVDAGELRALAAGWRPVGDEHGGRAWAVAFGLAGEESAQAGESDAEDAVEPLDLPRGTTWSKAGRLIRRVRDVIVRDRTC